MLPSMKDGRITLPIAQINPPASHFVSDSRTEIAVCIWAAWSQRKLQRIAIRSYKKDTSMETCELWWSFYAHPLLLQDKWVKKRNLRSSEFVNISWKMPSVIPIQVEAELATIHQGTVYSDCGVRILPGVPSSTRMAADYSFLDSSVPSVALSDSQGVNEVLQAVDCVDKQGFYVSTDYMFSLLQRCINEKDVAAGREVHSLIVKSGLESNAFLGSHLIRMFALSDSLAEANQVFSKLPNPNVYAWSAIISAHSKLGQNETAFKLYCEIHNSYVEPDAHIFVAGLKACASLANLGEGKLTHARIIQNGFEADEFIGSTLVDMYYKCGSLEDACMVFDRLPMRSAVTWSALIAGYVQQGNGQNALQIFSAMQQEGLQPDQVTFVCILKACSSISALKQGRQIHAHVLESGLQWDLCVGNTLIDMYAKCGSFQEACVVFDRLPKRDIVTWSALIAGYVSHGYGLEALQFFANMQQDGIEPNLITHVLILKACSNIAALEEGRQIHADIVERGFESDDFVAGTLIDMYGKCGSIEDARTLFEGMPKRNVVIWSAYIAGFAEHENSEDALQLFEKMQQEGVFPDKITFLCVLKACSSLLSLEQGRQVHVHIIESGFELDIYVGSALVDMYAKCGSLEDARTQSHRLPSQNVVTWSALLAGYAQHGLGQDAVQLFGEMSREGVQSDEVTFVSVLQACSSIAALENGRQVHRQIIESGYEFDVYIGSALIDMYAKCGSLEDACTAFERLPKENVETWSTMMSGYAQHGEYLLACEFFEDMQRAGLKPDDVAFLCILSACSHVSLADRGCVHFKSMRDEYGITPTLKHYNSMADILGHAGYLTEVEDLLETIPFQCNIVGWTSLLTSCRAHSDVDIGKQSFDRVIMMDRGNAAGFVLMGNIYSQAGLWEDAEIVEELRRYANGWKKPGRAFIEIGNQVHDFVVGDKTHPQTGKIYAKLEALNMKMREEGYKPRVDLVLDIIPEDDKEDALCGHCEKLAIAFGLICTPQGTTVRVAKNLRMCADCHIATKLISKIEMREIIVADAYCIHRFQDGACSCTDNF